MKNIEKKNLKTFKYMSALTYAFITVDINFLGQTVVHYEVIEQKCKTRKFSETYKKFVFLIKPVFLVKIFYPISPNQE